MLSELPDLALSSVLSVILDNLGSGPLASPDASGPLHLSSSEDRAELTGVSELSDDLTVGES